MTQPSETPMKERLMAKPKEEGREISFLKLPQAAMLANSGTTLQKGGIYPGDFEKTRGVIHKMVLLPGGCVRIEVLSGILGTPTASQVETARRAFVGIDATNARWEYV